MKNPKDIIWTVSNTNYIKNEEQKWSLKLSPNFIDIKKTDFPEGIEFTFNNQDDIKHLELAIRSMDNFFKLMIYDYSYYKKEDSEHIEKMKIYKINDTNPRKVKGYWTNVYWDCDPKIEEPNLSAYIRLAPSFMDLEEVGYPWGISILNKFYKNEEATNEDRLKIEKFMNNLIEEYFKYLNS